MGDATRTKRRRTDDADTPATPLVRSTEYWFDDGNIILQVESTQFRVAKSVLSRHSSVFRDMLMMPLPADEPTVENCPVVVLSGDTAQDWTLFLEAMYPKSLMEEVPRFELIAAILRLSKKYECPAFRQDCVRRLKTKFPTTLEEYDELEPWTCIKGNKNIYLPILRFAREIGLHSIIPLIYCHMLTLSRGRYMPKILNVDDASLGASDRFACLLGIANLQILQSTTTMAWLEVDLPSSALPAQNCLQPARCVAMVKETILEAASTHPPSLCVISEWNETWGVGMCRPCEKKAKDVFEAGREECWDKLPSMFGLPEWKELMSNDFE
ncbi:hypothetical protein DFH08DRAFT_169699 [Mycena albidolilacea]|uniref:BTB domain-containing protein n=1 Tax=Mycena albidolilacea TaxID=1033008 RepID=A0AAD7F363_9AGAR|nr:hypothetical protein DFH08DRAFT_169699 [Mycena albidolilacea]